MLVNSSGRTKAGIRPTSPSQMVPQAELSEDHKSAVELPKSKPVIEPLFVTHDNANWFSSKQIRAAMDAIAEQLNVSYPNCAESSAPLPQKDDPTG
ncbi:hypothetical protein [Rhizobium leguminosarum]|uniref:hypothetical protein n=1 Tax=Rhizobium leguminosarum TaxID=384 RepID=UPI003F96BDC9